MINCYDPNWGSFSNADGCYYQPISPPPPLTDVVWQGHTTGMIFQSTCLGGGGSGGGLVWRPAAPPGVAGTGPTPAELAAQAVDELPLRGPAIGMAPRPGSMGLVGLPVWLWTAVSPQTWGPVSATAAVPGLSVTATANAESIVWSMGDGGSVRCTKPGTPYRREFGNVISPDCGYRYSHSSAGLPGDAYSLTATTTWRITWSGGGESGALIQQRSSTLPVRIGELQVLVS